MAGEFIDGPGPDTGQFKDTPAPDATGQFKDDAGPDSPKDWLKKVKPVTWTKTGATVNQRPDGAVYMTGTDDPDYKDDPGWKYLDPKTGTLVPAPAVDASASTWLGRNLGPDAWKGLGRNLAAGFSGVGQGALGLVHDIKYAVGGTSDKDYAQQSNDTEAGERYRAALANTGGLTAKAAQLIGTAVPAVAYAALTKQAPLMTSAGDVVPAIAKSALMPGETAIGANMPIVSRLAHTGLQAMPYGYVATPGNPQQRLVGGMAAGVLAPALEAGIGGLTRIGAPLLKGAGALVRGGLSKLGLADEAAVPAIQTNPILTSTAAANNIPLTTGEQLGSDTGIGRAVNSVERSGKPVVSWFTNVNAGNDTGGKAVTKLLGDIQARGEKMGFNSEAELTAAVKADPTNPQLRFLSETLDAAKSGDPADVAQADATLKNWGTRTEISKIFQEGAADAEKAPVQFSPLENTLAKINAGLEELDQLPPTIRDNNPTYRKLKGLKADYEAELASHQPPPSPEDTLGPEGPATPPAGGPQTSPAPTPGPTTSPAGPLPKSLTPDETTDVDMHGGSINGPTAAELADNASADDLMPRTPGKVETKVMDRPVPAPDQPLNIDNPADVAYNKILEDEIDKYQMRNPEYQPGKHADIDQAVAKELHEKVMARLQAGETGNIEGQPPAPPSKLPPELQATGHKLIIPDSLKGGHNSWSDIDRIINDRWGGIDNLINGRGGNNLPPSGGEGVPEEAGEPGKLSTYKSLDVMRSHLGDLARTSRDPIEKRLLGQVQNGVVADQQGLADANPGTVFAQKYNEAKSRWFKETVPFEDKSVAKALGTENTDELWNQFIKRGPLEDRGQRWYEMLPEKGQNALKQEFLTRGIEYATDRTKPGNPFDKQRFLQYMDNYRGARKYLFKGDDASALGGLEAVFQHLQGRFDPATVPVKPSIINAISAGGSGLLNGPLRPLLIAADGLKPGSPALAKLLGQGVGMAAPSKTKPSSTGSTIEE